MPSTSLTIEELLALGFLPGMTSGAVRALAESGAGFGDIAGALPGELASLGVRRNAIHALSSPQPYIDQARQQVAQAEKFGANVLHFWDERYPARLREIYSPPICLYIWGNIGAAASEELPALAIVGTRNATVYGRLSAEKYATECARCGVAVVSGLARGIDTYAHTAALNAGGKTIAVIASGLDQLGPSYVQKLAEKIVENGALVTEYPFGTRALRPYFPQRNRIISGICKGTLIVESDAKGGAMITAQFTTDQNRELFAVPGPISSPTSRGTNLLIRTDRARLTQTPDDLLESLGYKIASAENRAPAVKADLSGLSLFEQQIYEALTEEPLHIDTLCEATGLPVSEMLVSLLTLEFKGMVRQMAGKMFLRG